MMNTLARWELCELWCPCIVSRFNMILWSWFCNIESGEAGTVIRLKKLMHLQLFCWLEQCKCTSIENIQTKINNSQYSFEYINIGNHNLHLFVSVKVKVVIKVATNNCLHLCQNVHNLLSLLWRESGWKIEIYKIEKWSERKKLLDSWQETLTCSYHSRPISSFSCFPKTVFNFSKENLLQRGISISVPEARE